MTGSPICQDLFLLARLLSSALVRRELPSHPHRLRTSSYLDSLHRRALTVLMFLHLVLMVNMIGVVLAFLILFFNGELALFQVVEESLVGHDMGWIEGTLHRSHSLIHRCYLYIIKTSLAFTGMPLRNE